MNTFKNILSVVLIFLALFQAPYFYYYAFGFLSFFLMIPYSIIALTLTATLITLITKKEHKNHKFHLISLCFSVVIGTLALFVEDQMEKVDWAIRKSARNEIVRMIKSEEIATESDVYYVKEYKLPPVSNGGNEIIIDKENGKLRVTFFIDRGFLDHFSAFVYTEDKDSLKDMAFGSIKGIRHIEGNWYRVAH